MKIRAGFVSNSSSSSFIIACKDDLKTEMETIIADTEHIVSPFDFATIAKDMVDQMIHQADVIFKSYEDIDDEFDLTREEVEQRFPGVLDKIENHGWTMYYGSVYDDEPENMMLVAMDINHESDTLIIQKESYY